MLVCNCRGVTDGQIRKLVREGASSTGQIVRATGAGRGCGGCRSAVRKVVAETVEQELAQRQHAESIALPMAGMAGKLGR
ncbi:MAG: bacterioferritin-associated ferredoxin [Myxococcota bacterium]